jgi:hypothetical protein
MNGRMRWISRRLGCLPVGVVVGAAVLAGCGSGAAGGGTDPSAVVKSYLNAFANGDGSTACSLLTPGARAQVLQGAKQFPQLGAKTCAQYVSKASSLTGSLKQTLSNATVGTASVSGNMATVSVSFKIGGQTESLPIHLTMLGGRWYVNQGNLAGSSSTPSPATPSTPATTTT